VLPAVEDFCRIVLLRHPELAPSHANVVVGAGEAPLSRRGRQRAVGWVDELARLELDAVFCADVSQCVEAATVLAKAHDLEPRPESRLRDQQMGQWQGRRWDEVAVGEPDAVRDFFGQFGERAAPGGESLGQAVERMLGWWQDTAPRALSQTLAVVTSGNLIAGFTTAMLGMRLSRAVSLSLPHGALGIVDVYANGARLAAWHTEALRDDVA
jgi:broad specificity phosphatase PhoE